MAVNRRNAAAAGLDLAAGSMGLGAIGAQLNAHAQDETVRVQASTGEIVEFGRQLPYAIRKIAPNPRNDYESMDEKALAELAASMRRVGCINAIILRPVQSGDPVAEGITAVLVCGENRWKAATLAGLESLPSRMILTPVPVTSAVEDEIMEGENDRRRGGTNRADMRRDYVRRKYLNLILSSKQGGSQWSGDRENLAERIERETHGKIPKGTAQRYIAEIRKEAETSRSAKRSGAARTAVAPAMPDFSRWSGWAKLTLREQRVAEKAFRKLFQARAGLSEAESLLQEIGVPRKFWK